MWASLFTNKQGYLYPFISKFFINTYLPFVAAGIRMKKVSADYHYLRIELALTFWNRNYVGTQFGGSIYAMTDPFFMLMFIQILGHDYIVWDKAAKIDFVKPGRGRVFVEFHLTDDEIALVKEKTKDGEKYFFEKEVLIKSIEGELVARVLKTVYIRLKPRLRADG